MRYVGKLKKWNADRGFGFIATDDGGQDIFVHVTAFPRDGKSPTEGEVLNFEVEPDHNGKRSAVRVRRPGGTMPDASIANQYPTKSSGSASSQSSFAKTLIGTLLIVALSLFAYSRYQKQVAQIPLLVPSAAPTPTPTPASGTTPLPLSAQPSISNFQCDGRKHCSQMTSCKEATFFLKHCPGVQMDGNHDGIPCEQQWCTSSFSE